MKRQSALLAAAAALQLAGCAGISQSECQNSDWRAVGYEDGSQGQPAHNFASYRKGCADHGVTLDFQAYQAGREAGLREYCQESRGFQEGSEGRSYAGVCPAESEVPFLYGYHDGRRFGPILHRALPAGKHALPRICQTTFRPLGFP